MISDFDFNLQNIKSNKTKLLLFNQFTSHGIIILTEWEYRFSRNMHTGIQHVRGCPDLPLIQFRMKMSRTCRMQNPSLVLATIKMFDKVDGFCKRHDGRDKVCPTQQASM